MASTSSQSTIADDTDIYTRFCRLEPVDQVAQEAFNEVIEAIRLDPVKFSHQRQFVNYYNANTQQAREHVRGDSSSSMQPTDSDSNDDLIESTVEERTSFRWNGYYCLCFGIPPPSPKWGWRVGSGRWKSVGDGPNGAVELLLAIDGSKFGIRGSHALLRLNIETETLTLHARHTRQDGAVLIIDHGSSLEYNDNGRGLTKQESSLRIGKATYRLCYEQSSEHLRQLKKDYFREHLDKQRTLSSLPPTPSEPAVHIAQWAVYGVVGWGTSSVFRAAVNAATNKVAAAKVVSWKTPGQLRRAKSEVQTLTAIKQAICGHEHSQNVLRLIEIINPGGNAKLNPEDRSVGDVYVFMEPLGSLTLIDVIADSKRTTYSTEDRLRYLRDIVQGLSALHCYKYSHRDIKPANIVLVDRGQDNQIAVLIDLGNAVELYDDTVIRQNPGSVGTIGWLAPEVECMSYGTGYGRPADVWSVGQLAYWLLKGQPSWYYTKSNIWLHRTKVDHVRIFEEAIEVLNAAPIKDPWDELIAQMLELDPARRPSAPTVLEGITKVIAIVGNVDVSNVEVHATEQHSARIKRLKES